MENYDWTQFSRSIAVKAPIRSIYHAWTIPNELERWFLSEARFFDASDKQIDKTNQIVAGNRYEWHWHLWDGTETGILTESNGTDHLQFTFAGDCLVDVKLSEYELGTILKLSQTNIPTDEKSKVNVRLGCDSGWSFYLVNLKSIYEGGIDLRNKDKNLKMMLNN